MQFNQLFELSSRKKLAIALTWDCFALVCASVFAFWIRLGIARWDFTQSDAVAIALNVVLALVLLLLLSECLALWYLKVFYPINNYRMFQT